ncbi:hypothetical protein GPECTOR_7g965 [Gonium pectorale]|uniref:Uncharacterized protein n=1 Tax=Gonium pectorale TaxID=33097 RepID=A0A150GUH7_GONPE|nr:hypothetical protein GPECTOR_7g965 [Gonium pectorale]|eukprot:KXZ53515.1 hypothetical protein GPECTOR_7g965 [Gonium pectorale]
MDWLVENIWASSYPCCCDYAAACPDGLEGVHYLRQRSYVVSMRTLSAAARAGNVDLVAELLAEGVEASSFGMLTIEGGHVNVMHELLVASHTLRLCMLNIAFDLAVLHGNLPAATWMVEELGLEPSTLHTLEAAQSGSLDLVTYLHERGAKMTQKAVEYGAQGGNRAILEWLAAHSGGIPPPGGIGAVG